MLREKGEMSQPAIPFSTSPQGSNPAWTTPESLSSIFRGLPTAFPADGSKLELDNKIDLD
jgi:hypothetical protein